MLYGHIVDYIVGMHNQHIANEEDGFIAIGSAHRQNVVFFQVRSHQSRQFSPYNIFTLYVKTL
jgi:hypothetical protein